MKINGKAPDKIKLLSSNSFKGFDDLHELLYDFISISTLRPIASAAAFNRGKELISSFSLSNPCMNLTFKQCCCCQ